VAGRVRQIRPDDDAAEVLFLGDMRYLKGVDVLLKALALIQRKRAITAAWLVMVPTLQSSSRSQLPWGLRTLQFPADCRQRKL
jgi:hypothetical protein